MESGNREGMICRPSKIRQMRRQRIKSAWPTWHVAMLVNRHGSIGECEGVAAFSGGKILER